MKNQYFADKRDFFKWDLLEDLVGLSEGQRALCYVAMLTPADGRKEGLFKKYDCGARRPELHEFLRDCLSRDRQKVVAMREYFSSRSIDYRPIGDTRSGYYSHASRRAYFDKIPATALRNAVVFFDPDIGLNAGTDSYMARVGLDKYLFEDDLSKLSSRIDHSSVVVVYQHLQRDRSRIWDDIEERCLRVSHALETRGASFVTDRDVSFLVTSRDSKARLYAGKLVVEHAHKHGLDSGELVNRKR